MLSACVPTSENPIISKSGVADPRFAGDWTGKTEDGSAVTVHFLKRKDGELGALFVMRASKPESTDEWASFRFTTADLNNARYLSALYDYNDGKPVEAREKGYHLMHYRFADDGTLQLFAINEQKLMDRVRMGKVDGKIEGEGAGADVRLTASPDNLAKFLKRNAPEDLFDKPFMMLTHTAQMAAGPSGEASGNIEKGTTAVPPRP